MLSLHVSVPVACFRKGMAREFLETDPMPPPATCYGMLLSLVGQPDRRRHIGARVTGGLLGQTVTSTVLRTVWRVKTNRLGAAGNVRPDFQQLLTGAGDDPRFIELILHLDSGQELSRVEPDGRGTLEQEVTKALDPSRRHEINRYGGLCMGESAHLVDSVSIVNGDATRFPFRSQRIFLLNPRGLLSLPVWVDHVGARRTRHVIGDVIHRSDTAPPAVHRIPMIGPD